MTRHAAVVGSGVFGITAAIALRDRGWEVTVLDQGRAPHPKATSNDLNRVIRADYGKDGFFVELGLEAIAGWERWNETWPAPAYRPDGFLLLSRSGLDPGTFEGDSYRNLVERGVPVEILDPAAVRRRFPVWRPEGYAVAYFNPRAGWARADLALARLIDLAAGAGVRVRGAAPVRGLLESDGRVQGVELRHGGRVEADVTVVAAGPWTPRLLPWLEDAMWPSGQPILYLRAEDPLAWRAPRFSPWAADLANTGWYGIAGLADGRVKVAHHGEGVRVDPGADDLVVGESTERLFRHFLRDHLPDLADAPLAASRICVYCDTWDGDFWIDHDPERPGLVVATGGSGHGFKFAPVLGDIVADAVERRENPRLSRFAWRTPGGRRTEHARSLRPPGDT